MTADIITCDENQLLASICKDSFEEFIREFWHCVPGVGPLVWNWHLTVFAEELQEIAERIFLNLPKTHDLCTNVSPGTTKSLIYSVLFPAWLWTRMPGCRILTGSYATDLVLDLASKSRDVIQSEFYQECFPNIVIREDTKAKGHYKNNHGGERKVCTVGGRSPLGFHAHVIIVDDPIDPSEVLSQPSLLSAKNFMTVVISNRKVDKAVTPTILVMQRLGLGDPTEVMLKEAEKPGAAAVRHLCFPSELRKNDDGSWSSKGVYPPEFHVHYTDGLMDPVRLSRPVLDENKAHGDLFYTTQFLQQPYSRTGGMFEEQFFNNRVRAAPYIARRVRFWDIAATRESGDYTVGTLLSRDADGNFYVEDVVRGQWEPHARNQIMRAAALRDRARYGPKHEPVIWVEEQGGAAGKDAFRGVVKALAGFTVKQHRVAGEGKKEFRADPWSAQCAGGSVYLVEDGHWRIQEFIDEHCAFPTGGHDDQVDSASGAFAILTREKRMPLMRTLSIDRKKDNKLKIYLCTEEDLEATVLEERSLLVHILDPLDDPERKPNHALIRLLDQASIICADIDPADVQEKIRLEGKGDWEKDSIEPYGLPIHQLTLPPNHGKKMWSVLLRKRDPWALNWVVCGPEDGRTTSVAYALCDTLRLKRSETIFKFLDETWKAPDKDSPPNQHIYDTVRTTRMMVV